jgi:hypothetical protein
MANTGHVADRVETDGDRPPFCPRIGSASITEIDEVRGTDPFTQSVEPRMGLQFIDGLISPGGQTAVADYKSLKTGRLCNVNF